MGHYEPGEEGDDAYRYQLKYMTDAIGAAQAHRTPAYRELYRDTIEKLIEKMLRFDVWSYWATTSRGSKILDPDLEKLGEGWMDPVIHKNVMYSGRLFNMVGLYEQFYRTGRYDRPGSLSFEFRPIWRGMGPETFEYDHSSLGQAILREYERNDYLGCECEPNTIFVVCNLPVLLGFRHYDHTHATQISPDLEKRFEAAWRERSGLFDPDAKGADVPMYWLVRQQAAAGDGLKGIALWAQMHPIYPEYAKLMYPRYRDGAQRKLPDGTIGANDTVFFENRGDKRELVDLQWDPMMLGVHIFGGLAMSAAEFGDQETLDGMLAYAERYLSPNREDGCLHYPRYDDGGTNHYVTCLTGNALISNARLNVPNGNRTLYNEPWTQEQLDEPQLVEVDYPRVLVQQAWYDRAEKRLAIGLLPGESCSVDATFAISGLDKGGKYEIAVNGQPIDGETGRIEWREDRLHVATRLSASTSIVVTDKIFEAHTTSEAPAVAAALE